MKKIAIVLCLVFVISISLVVCFAFVPMSAKQVASAQVSTIDAGSLYTFNVTSGLSNSGYVTCDCYVYLDFSAPSSYESMHHINSWYYAVGSTYDYWYFLTNNNGDRLNPSAGDIYSRYDGNTLTYYVYSNGVWESLSNSRTLYIGGFVANLGVSSSFQNLNDFNRLKNSLTFYRANFFVNDVPPSLGLISSIPVEFYVDTNPHTNFLNYIFHGVQIINGDDYITTIHGTPGTWITFSYLVSGDNQWYEGDDVLCYSSFAGIGDVWLILSLPVDTVDVRLWFTGYPNYVLQLSQIGDSELYLNYLGAFTDNGAVSDYLLTATYNLGHSQGVIDGTESASGNNLVNLIWNVFQFPIKILFGSYNDTTHHYEGGLFNFTVLGLDIRAFVLSIMSVCLVIGCIKIVLGARGNSNG